MKSCSPGLELAAIRSIRCRHQRLLSTSATFVDIIDFVPWGEAPAVDSQPPAQHGHKRQRIAYETHENQIDQRSWTREGHGMAHKPGEYHAPKTITKQDHPTDRGRQPE